MLEMVGLVARGAGVLSMTKMDAGVLVGSRLGGVRSMMVTFWRMKDGGRVKDVPFLMTRMELVRVKVVYAWLRWMAERVSSSM